MIAIHAAQIATSTFYDLSARFTNIISRLESKFNARLIAFKISSDFFK